MRQELNESCPKFLYMSNTYMLIEVSSHLHYPNIPLPPVHPISPLDDPTNSELLTFFGWILDTHYNYFLYKYSDVKQYSYLPFPYPTTSTTILIRYIWKMHFY